MKKLIPAIVGLALFTGSMAMAAPASKVCKTTHRTAVKKQLKKSASKKLVKPVSKK